MTDDAPRPAGDPGALFAGQLAALTADAVRRAIDVGRPFGSYSVTFGEAYLTRYLATMTDPQVRAFGAPSSSVSSADYYFALGVATGLAIATARAFGDDPAELLNRIAQEVRET